MTFVTGDTHGRLHPFYTFRKFVSQKDNLIILGDAGFNYFLDERDARLKQSVNDLMEGTIYCVRGNHEERPENISSMICEMDENVQGKCYYETDYPRIKYLIDGNEYIFNNKKCLVIGGAYSVDKQYRLDNGWNWFESEQLTQEEQKAISEATAGKYYDFVLTHTCPVSWQPSELFMKSIDQSKVDSSMEIWLEDVKNSLNGFDYWLFGHYHADMLIRPHVQMFYKDIISFENIEEMEKLIAQDSSQLTDVRISKDYYERV